MTVIDWRRYSGKTLSGPKHQNGGGPKEENQRRANQPALLLLLSLKLPEAYRSRQENSRAHKKHPWVISY